MLMKTLFSKPFLTAAASLFILAFACNWCNPPPPPPTTTPPLGCSGKVTTLRVTVAVEGFGELPQDQTIDIQENTGIEVKNTGKGRLRYGSSNTFTIYAPSQGSGAMTIEKWNGTRTISVQAGSGYVVEDSSEIGCKLTVVQLGSVQLVAAGTEYGFSIDPTTQQVLVGVAYGTVEITDINSNKTNLTAHQGIEITKGIPGEAFQLPVSPEGMQENFDKGLNYLGQPLGVAEVPPQEQPQEPPQEPPPGPEARITVWYPTTGNPDEDQGFQDQADIFMKDHPGIEINVEFVPLSDFMNKYQTLSAAGDAPTLSIQGSANGPLLYDNKMVADITSLLTNEIMSSMSSLVFEQISYKGAILGLPYRSRGVVMYRNKNIIPDPPKTIFDLIEMAKAASAGNEFIYGAYLETGFYFSGGILNGIGGSLMDGEGKPTFADEMGAKWLDLLNMYKEAGPICNYTDEDLDSFMQGSTGIIIDGTWNLPRLVDAIGAENLSIDPWPYFDRTYLSGYVETYVIYLNPNISGNELEAAWAFMQYLLSTEAQAYPTGRTLAPAVRGVEVDDPLINQVSTAFVLGTPKPILPQMEAYWEPLNRAILNAVFEGWNPLEALKVAFEEVRYNVDK